MPHQTRNIPHYGGGGGEEGVARLMSADSLVQSSIRRSLSLTMLPGVKDLLAVGSYCDGMRQTERQKDRQTLGKVRHDNTAPTNKRSERGGTIHYMNQQMVRNA